MLVTKRQVATKLRYEPALNGIRGFAVLAVALSHAVPGMGGGRIGVDLFFVLSGYLITRLLEEEMRETGRVDLLAFYIRRALRLMPAFVLLLTCYVAGAFIWSDNPLSHLKATFWAATYLMTWVEAFAKGTTGLLGHTWSLAVEEHFYLIWPLIIFASRPKFRLPLTVVLMLTSAIWRAINLFVLVTPISRSYFAFDTRAESLLIGCTLALVSARFTLTEHGRKSLVAVALAASFGLMAFLFLDDGSRLIVGPGFTIIGWAAAAIVAAAMLPTRFRAFLRWPPFVFLGTISYGFYLWHFVLLKTLGSGRIVEDMLALIATVIVAALSYYGLERPLGRLKPRIKGFRTREDLHSPEDHALKRAWR